MTSFYRILSWIFKIKSVGNYLTFSVSNIKMYSVCTYSFYTTTIKFTKCPFSSASWKSLPALQISAFLGFSGSCIIDYAPSLYCIPPRQKKNSLPRLRSTNWQFQNSHRDVKDSVGNIVNDIVETKYDATGY